MNNGHDQVFDLMLELADSVDDPSEAADIRGELEFAVEEASEHVDDVLWGHRGALYEARAELIAIGAVGSFSGHAGDGLDHQAIHRALDEAGIAGEDEACFLVPWWAHPYTLLQLSYSQRKQLLTDILAAANRMERAFRPPARATTLLGMDEPRAQAENGPAIELGMRCLVGIVVRYGEDTNEFVDLEQLQRLSATLHQALCWDDHFPLTVVSFDTFR